MYVSSFLPARCRFGSMHCSCRRKLRFVNFLLHPTCHSRRSVQSPRLLLRSKPASTMLLRFLVVVLDFKFRVVVLDLKIWLPNGLGLCQSTEAIRQGLTPPTNSSTHWYDRNIPQRSRCCCCLKVYISLIKGLGLCSKSTEGKSLGIKPRLVVVVYAYCTPFDCSRTSAHN